MTNETLQEKISIMNRFMNTEKWKKNGQVQYPKGKRAFAVLEECIQFIFAEDEISVCRQVFLRDPECTFSGVLLLCRLHMESGDCYCLFQLSETVFAVAIYPKQFNSIYNSHRQLMNNALNIKESAKEDPVILPETDPVEKKEKSKKEEDIIIDDLVTASQKKKEEIPLISAEEMDYDLGDLEEPLPFI